MKGIEEFKQGGSRYDWRAMGFAVVMLLFGMISNVVSDFSEFHWLLALAIIFGLLMLHSLWLENQLQTKAEEDYQAYLATQDIHQVKIAATSLEMSGWSRQNVVNYLNRAHTGWSFQ